MTEIHHILLVEVPDSAVDAVPARLLPHPAGQARRAQVPPPEPGQVEAAAAELGESRANFPSFLNAVMINNHSKSTVESMEVVPSYLLWHLNLQNSVKISISEQQVLGVVNLGQNSFFATTFYTLLKR